MLVGYMRVSTDGDRQVFDLRRDALLAAGVDEHHLFEDPVSGSRGDRAGLARALAFLRTGDCLVVWKLLYSGKSRLCVMAAFLLATFDLACGFAPRDQTSLRGRHQGRRNMGSEGYGIHAFG